MRSRPPWPQVTRKLTSPFSSPPHSLPILSPFQIPNTSGQLCALLRRHRDPGFSWSRTVLFFIAGRFLIIHKLTRWMKTNKNHFQGGVAVNACNCSCDSRYRYRTQNQEEEEGTSFWRPNRIVFVAILGIVVDPHYAVFMDLQCSYNALSSSVDKYIYRFRRRIQRFNGVGVRANLYS